MVLRRLGQIEQPLGTSVGRGTGARGIEGGLQPIERVV